MVCLVRFRALIVLCVVLFLELRTFSTEAPPACGQIICNKLQVMLVSFGAFAKFSKNYIFKVLLFPQILGLTNATLCMRVPYHGLTKTTLVT